MSGKISQIEYTILGVIAEYTIKSGYAATWHIADVLGVARGDFYNSSYVYNAALKNLISQNLVEEVPDLGERYRLKIEKVQE